MLWERKPLKARAERITELQNHKLEKASKIISSNLWSIATLQPDQSTECTSSRILNNSRGGDSTTSLDSLFQCLRTLSVKKFFLKIQPEPALAQPEAVCSCPEKTSIFWLFPLAGTQTCPRVPGGSCGYFPLKFFICSNSPPIFYLLCAPN